MKTLVLLVGILVVGLALVELVSWAGLSTYVHFHEGKYDPKMKLDPYQQQEWAAAYFTEFAEASVMEYYPYIGHRRIPSYEGTYVNIDEQGRRKTSFHCADRNGQALKIFLFGGSTMWGSGARDEGTIPSQLAKALCEQGIPVQVTNYGESGYVSTQEVIRLSLELQQRNIPDIVLFYDGFNDVFATYQTREAGFPQNVQHRQQEFNARQRFHLWGLVPHTQDIIERVLYWYLKGGSLPPLDESLAEEASAAYAGNRKLVEAWAAEYDLQPFFYWQPVLYTKKILSPEEQKLPWGKALAFSYDLMTEKVLSKNEVNEVNEIHSKNKQFLSPEVRDLTTLFDNQTETVYVDWSHISEEGNAQVAEAMAEDIAAYVRAHGLTRKANHETVQA